MNYSENPAVIIIPPVYELLFGGLISPRWCKLKDVCGLVPQVARLAGNDFSPTPGSLVNRFAALTRLNKGTVSNTDKNAKKIKIFRYSRGGKSFSGTEVPIGPAPEFGHPPYYKFKLGVGLPYPKNLFVTEEWALATLNAIRLGVVAVTDYGDFKIGWKPPKGNHFDTILLDGDRQDVLLMRPPKLS